MTPHIEQLTTEQSRLFTAINRISNQYQTAINRLEELEASLPGLIATVALGEADISKLEAAQQEIGQLRVLSKDPYREAIGIIETRRTTISGQITKEMGDQAAVDRERLFRKLYNRCMETHSRTPADWALLRNTQEHWHRQDVDQLDRLHYEFDNKGYHYQPDSPTFAEYCASKGLALYNLDVTIENIIQPKEMHP